MEPNVTTIYCAFDTFNLSIDQTTGKEKHICDKYGTYFCKKCDSAYDGVKIRDYMNTHERIE